MEADRGDVMLVGSVAIPEDELDAAGVLGLCGPKLGGHVSMLPDGEVGDRYYWINYIARNVYYSHPDLVTLSRHTYENWKPDPAFGLQDHWKFALRDGITELRFDKLGYADEAKKSYEAFTRLREAGEIAPGTRFQIALPAPESGTRPFVDTAHSFEILFDAYVDVVGREIDDICAAIPHEDLAIQWDICLETASIEGFPFGFAEAELTRHDQNPLTRTANIVAELSTRIPEPVWLGLHLCYGSLGQAEGGAMDGAHFKEIEDLNVCVDIANSCVGAMDRSVQFIHMPVQVSRGFDDAYYAPLKRLAVGDARIYLGLIDMVDGIAGARRRIEIARNSLSDFGIATQCGWGRRPASYQLYDILDLHVEAVAAMS
ncbi:hypothetical protein [Mycolicibacterium moriokaense]|uniref:Methionine synthase n=1 Tax=Mycolicibacterium moriokaense TaxID=39691 RepID=A0A318H738_9MYCO|nr:hypothetical protein [Mycolicibacterium moriokaense]PXX00356.1 hypothetical protein C8E89_1348 [Mycolicibacterium moriokaense]